MGLESSYASGLLPPLLVVGFGLGLIMPTSIQTATYGVEGDFAGVASALVNTSQQVGGSIGTALLNTLAATAATSYVAAHLPPGPEVLAQAAVHSYAVGCWWAAGFFAFGAVLAALLSRRRGQRQPAGRAPAGQGSFAVTAGLVSGRPGRTRRAATGRRGCWRAPASRGRRRMHAGGCRVPGPAGPRQL